MSNLFKRTVNFIDLLLSEEIPLEAGRPRLNQRGVIYRGDGVSAKPGATARPKINEEALAGAVIAEPDGSTELLKLWVAHELILFQEVYDEDIVQI
jgi:hypothetical protein